MFLFDIILERVHKIREFILLPWEEQKKRIHEYWKKYWRIAVMPRFRQ